MLSKKKGFFALEALISVILSVIVLVILFSFFVDVFLYKPTNQKIAESNALSIVDFIDHSESLFYNEGFCYNTLKTSQLNYYQLEEDNKEDNYFYIINNNGVGMEKLEKYNDYLNEYIDINPDKIEFYEFKNPVNIYFDKTSTSVFTLNGFKDIDVDITSSDLKYILMKPILDNKNAYEIWNIKPDASDKKVKVDGKYLIYQPETNSLFFNKNDLSLAYVNDDLCVVRKEILTSLSNIDYNTNDLFISTDKYSPEISFFVQSSKSGIRSNNAVNKNLISNAYLSNCWRCFDKSQDPDNIIFIDNELVAYSLNKINGKFEQFNQFLLSVKSENAKKKYIYNGKELKFKIYNYKSIDGLKNTLLYVSKIEIDGEDKKIYLTQHQLKASEVNR